jgi:hypothetical protein
MLKVIPVDIEIPPRPQDDWRLHAWIAHDAMENGDLKTIQEDYNLFVSSAQKARDAAKKAVDVVRKGANYATDKTKKAAKDLVNQARGIMPLHPETIRFQNELLQYMAEFKAEHQQAANNSNDILNNMKGFNEQYIAHAMEYENLLKQLLAVNMAIMQKMSEVFSNKNQAPPSPPHAQPQEPHAVYQPQPNYPPEHGNPQQGQETSPGENQAFDLISTASAKVFRVCQGKNTYYCVRRAN